ncbi:MAG: DMT family transporter [Candidatus Woesearchaeota archaeon]
MAAVLFALLAMVLWGFEELFLKKAISGMKSMTTLLINTIVGILVVACFVLLFLDGFSWLSGVDLWLVLIAAVTSFFGYFFLYKALEAQKLSLIASLDESWIIISVVIAIVLFAELPSFLQVSAIFLVISGAFLVSVNFRSIGGIKLLSGAGFEFASLVFTGITVPLEKVVVQRVGEANAIIYIAVLVLPLIFLARFVTAERFVRPTWDLARIAAWSGVFDGTAFALYLLALNKLSVAVVAPIIASSVVVSLVLARIYLKEKMTPKEIVGAGLILAGVVILSIRYG